MSFRRPSLHNIPELNRLVEEIIKRPPDAKDDASIELKSVYIKYTEYSEIIFEKLRDLLQKPDINCKLGGLVAIDHLTSVIQENETIAFLNKCLSPVFQQFTLIDDIPALHRTAIVFGKLLRMGGTKISQLVEADIEEAFRWIQADNTKEVRKLAAILALKQMLIEEPYLSFNKIFLNNKSFYFIWNIVREKKLYLREAALDFMHISIQNISQRELNIQTNWLSNIYAEIKATKTSADPDIVHGNIIVLRSLLAFISSKSFFDSPQEVSEYVLSHKNNRQSFVQTAVIKTIPNIAKFKPGHFCKNYFETSLDFLLKYGLSAKGTEKSICYETLASLFELIDSSFLEIYMSKIITNLINELKRRSKPFCSELIKCLGCLRYKLGKKFREYVDIEELCELILINGLYPQSLKFLDGVCKLMEEAQVDDQVDLIQLKLLMTISSILSGQIYEFHRRSTIYEMKIARFRKCLTSELENKEFRTTESMALALQALAGFNFSHYVDSMVMFVRDVVLEYLNNDASVIRKAAAKAGSLLHIRKTFNDEMIITTSLANDALNKFLSVCLSDPDSSVRETMLASLNKNFDMFLQNPKYLKMLLACLNDPNYKVQANSLRIICRLIKFDPAEIVPYIKKKILQILNALTYQYIYNEEEKIELLGLLTCMIEDAPDLISPHTDTLSVAMISMLNDAKTTNNMIPHILTSFRKLAITAKYGLLPYLNDFFHILIQCMQDMSSSTKREVSIKAITQLIRSTGYVILPYYKYPNLLDTLLYLLKNETNMEIRTSLLRLMGALGALDAFYYKKIQLRLAENQGRFTVDEIIPKYFKYSFMITKRIEEADKRGNQSKSNLIKFCNDLLIVNDIDQKKKVDHPEKIFQTQMLLDSQHKLEERAYNERYMQKTHIANDEVEELLHSHTPINISNPDYHTRVIIKALLKVLCDPTLNQHHYSAIEALTCILQTLKNRFASFLDLVIPVFIHLINTAASVREILIQQLETIVGLCDANFSGQFVEPVLELTLTYITNQEGILMTKCFELLLTLIKTSKAFLRHQMELITAKLNQIMSTFEDAKDVVRNVLFIYSELGELLDPYLEHIIALLTKIAHNYSFLDPESLGNIINFFNVCITTCPSTIQQLSKIVHSLVFLLDQNPSTHQTVVNCFVSMIFYSKDDFLMYFPLVNSYVVKHQIQNELYQKCVEMLLSRDSFDEIEILLEKGSNQSGKREDSEDESLGSDYQRSFISNNYMSQPLPLRNTDINSLLEEFKTEHKDLEKDWVEWMRKSSLELLRQNPYPALYFIHPLAEMYSPIARELYNVAFVTCWCMLDEKQRDTMIKRLIKAIKHPKAPVYLLQTILNLAEFMQHDREVLPIDNHLLGGLAERCLAYAKALYYRELEFEISPESSIEPLVDLYVSLGHSEAANGMIVYAKNVLGIELRTIWYEALGKWEEALGMYNKQEAETEEDYFVSKMRCLNAMSDWEMIMNNCDPLIEIDKDENIDKRKQVIQLAANAALNLNQWDKLERYTEKMEDRSFEDHSFFQAIMSLRRNKFDQSMAYINRSREVLDSKVSGLLLESYSRAYGDVVKLQQLLEMEEMIEFKKEESKLLLEVEEIKKYSLQSPEKFKSKIEIMYSNNQISQINSIKTLKQQLIEKWNDRLNGCQPSIDVSQQILAVRSILLSKYENLDSWLRFCKLCMKQDQIQICQRTLESIKKDVLNVIADEDKHPPKLILMSMECDYARGLLKINEFIEKICGYIDKLPEAFDIKSRCYMKIGNYLKRDQEKMTNASIAKIISYYEKSTEFDKDNYKAWHFLGLMNFEAVEYYQNLNDKPEKTGLLPYILPSLNSFVKAVSLGATNIPTSKSFQDTLRLLTLWFNYGDLPSVAKIIANSFQKINMASWIEVVPQLIARFDIPNLAIQRLIHTLLKYIGSNHPQALIYSLTVALKEKMSARRAAAERILEDMKLKYQDLIDQALLVSDELCRTAILLKEQWNDAIREGTRFYQSRDYETMLRILMPYHEAMRKPPETLSEIAFHQAFKQELAEAEAWLTRFVNTKDEYCVNHAWEIYHTIYRKINEKLTNLNTVFLENASPRLLNTKNTILSIPGLYAPHKPLITIAGFAAKLDVLASKQRPRRMLMFGSNGKEYTFLLKGHEDTRQDERVMQLFSLVNKIMAAESGTRKKDLIITRYSVVPLSTRAGLIGWVHNSDPLQKLVREYRESFKIIQNSEMRLLTQMCPNFTHLSLPNKLEVFRNMFDRTKGEDLKKVLWLKSPNSEVWLERRTSYTRSLATMSMVGYILGLGDRHPSNIMLQRITGKVVHIDFGDCFEVAMKREEVPERVPFRLTRMLVKVMEACTIEGTYRLTCEDVMRVLRNNKDSLMAVLQAFVYDPLVNWRLLTPSDAKQEVQNQSDNKNSEQLIVKSISTGIQRMPSEKIVNRKMTAMLEPSGAERSVSKKKATFFPGLEAEQQDTLQMKEDIRERELKAQIQEEENRPTEILNHRAVEVVDRIKKKLTGKDFKENEVLNVKSQVDKLIRQASSQENICQSFIGWCPFW